MGGRKKQPIEDVVEEDGEKKVVVVKTPNFPWDNKLESFFLELILQGIRAGLRSGGHFKNQFWHDCVAMFKNSGHPVPSLEQLNSKRNTWLARWRCFHRLLEMSGWNFDGNNWNDHSQRVRLGGTETSRQTGWLVSEESDEVAS